MKCELTTNKMITVPLSLLCLLVPISVYAAVNPGTDLTRDWVGYTVLAIFILAYIIVILEEYVGMRKSKPVVIAAGLIWTLIAFSYRHQDAVFIQESIHHYLLDYGKLLLFLLVAMTYINTLEERGIFRAISAWLINRRFSLRTIFWLTGVLAFFISPVADNLTTALVMSTVVLSVSGNNRAFAAVGCINVVVAANAGGAFTPFGDITTLMVWQKGVLEFHEFLVLFIPALVNWFIPAICMSFVLPKEVPAQIQTASGLQHGALIVAGLFLLTIIIAVAGYNYLHMSPVIGMMTGLGLLNIFGYYLSRRDRAFDIFASMKSIEWDTLLFFYGIIMCVGGLGTVGYLAIASELMYGNLGATNSNILIGILSALIDNIPLMFAVLSMNPDMSNGQWLLVTLTAGVGGSLLSIGSAAGVAVMGQARGIYTFYGHLKWTWAIAIGYAASIWAHFLVNAATFSVNPGAG